VSVRAHLPPEAQAFFGRDRAWCATQAARVGPSCAALIEQLLSDHVLERLRAAQGVLSDRTALLALVLAPVGYLVSYRRRSSTNVAIKVALALGLLVATARVLGQIGYVSPDAARAPLAALFLWVQVLHAFDVPRRRDLSFSMVSSTTMIAVGGALALSTSYLWWLLAWAVASGAWLWTSSRPLAGDLRPATIARERTGRSRACASVVSVAPRRSCWRWACCAPAAPR
jgi:hypothetical protein